MENNNLNNLPPFYVGQKVVYIGWRKDLKDKTYIVDNILNQKNVVVILYNLIHFLMDVIISVALVIKHHMVMEM